MLYVVLGVKSRMTHYPEEAHNPLLSLATHCRARPNARQWSH